MSSFFHMVSSAAFELLR